MHRRCRDGKRIGAGQRLRAPDLPSPNDPHAHPALMKATLADLGAGLSIAGLLLPEAVAYAGIAGLPPQAGVLSLLVGLAVYGFFGSSRFAIVSATSSSAAVLFAATSAIDGASPAPRMAAG